MGSPNNVRDRTLERQGRVLGRSGEWFLLVGAILAIPGIVLIVLTTSWAYGVGWALVALGGGPLVVGAALLLSGLVSRWSARHRSFA
jgi:hypothetical protein